MNGDDLVRCPDIGRALAVKACLRRRREQRYVYPACVGCSIGEANASAEVVAEAAPPQPRPDPRPGSHLWGGEVPDVPLGPAPGAPPAAPIIGLRPDEHQAAHVERRGGLAMLVVERSTHARGAGASPEPSPVPTSQHPAPPAPVDHEPPAEPAQEEQMPKGQREKACPGCGTMATRCKKDCPGEKAPARAAPARRPAPRPLEAKPFRELAELRRRLMSQVADIDEEFAARRDELQDVGPAAPARLVAAEARATG